MVASTPNWADILSGVGSMVGAMSLVAAAIYGYKQVRDARKESQVAVIADLGRRWDSDELIHARQQASALTDVQLAEAAKEWDDDPAKHPEFFELLRIPNFLDDLGLVAECGSVDIDIVNRSMRFIVLEQWGKWRRAVMTLRLQDPTAFQQYESLVRHLQGIAPPS